MHHLIEKLEAMDGITSAVLWDTIGGDKRLVAYALWDEGQDCGVEGLHLAESCGDTGERALEFLAWILNNREDLLRSIRELTYQADEAVAR